MGRARRRGTSRSGIRELRGARDTLTGAAFAGTYGTRDGDVRLVERALRSDGPGDVSDPGALLLAATPADALTSGRVVCAVDGRPRLEQLAMRLGVNPATAEHTLLGLGLERLGADMLACVGGEFALVVWDRSRDRGLVARDRSGGRPLFAAQRSGTLLFGSEVRNVLDLLPAHPGADEDALARWLARAPTRDGNTLFAGIASIPPGHALRLEAGRWSRIRYWRPEAVPQRKAETREAARLIRSELGAAVTRSLEGAERPAVMLSGGLDSAAVAAAAHGTLATAYSGVFPAHPDIDESSEIAATSEHLGLARVESRFNGGSALAAADEFIGTWRLPPVSPNRFVWAALYGQAVRDGIDVLLGGQGGDELFGCAYYLIADRLRSGRLPAALRLARDLPGMGDRPHPRWLTRALLAYGVRPALPLSIHERMRAARGRASGPDWLAAPVRDDRWEWKRDDGPRWRAYLRHVLTRDAFGLTEHSSREAGMHGLRFAQPLRDAALVELMLSLPPALGFDRHLDRPLARHALRDDLPPELLRRSRKPVFNRLLEDALDGPDRTAVRDLLSAPRPELERLLRPGAVAGLLDARVVPRPPARALDLWRIVTLELWLRNQAGEPSAPTSLRSGA